MPRLNVERTKEKKRWDAHLKYLEDHFPGRSVNTGWYQDDESITSKVYGSEPVVVTTTDDGHGNYTHEEEPYVSCDLTQHQEVRLQRQ